MSSIPPVSDGPVEAGASIVRDRTPEREEVERTITPVGGGRFGGNRTGAIVGVAAVVAALFFINVGGKRDTTATRTIAMTPDAKVRPDQHAAQTQQFDLGAGRPGGPPDLAGMPLTDVLIFKRGIPAVRATKILYYKMAEFAGRLLPPPKIIATSGEALPPVAWNDKVPIAAGAPLSAATTPHLTEGQLDGLDELPVDALHFDPDIDPFAAIERGDDPEEATRRWMMASINGIDDGRALA